MIIKLDFIPKHIFIGRKIYKKSFDRFIYIYINSCKRPTNDSYNIFTRVSNTYRLVIVIAKRDPSLKKAGRTSLHESIKTRTVRKDYSLNNII